MESTDRPITCYPVPKPQHKRLPGPSASHRHRLPLTRPSSSPNPNYGYQSNPYNYNQTDPTALRCAALLRRVLAFAIGPILILSTTIFIAWLILRPQTPQFRVDSFSFSNFTLANTSSISFSAEVLLTARNPNKKLALSYDLVAATVYYRSWPLARTAVPPFSLDTKSLAMVTASFASVGNFVEHFAVEGINRERGSNGNVGFNLRMFSRVRFKERAWGSRNNFLKVFCGDLFVGIPSNGRSGSLTGGPRWCRVEI